MTDNLILCELKKIYDALTKCKDKHTLIFRMTGPNKWFHFI